MGASVSSLARRTVLSGKTGRRVFNTRRDVEIVNKANTREYTSIASSSFRGRSNRIQIYNLPKTINKWMRKESCSNNAVFCSVQQMRSADKDQSSPKQQQKKIVHHNFLMRFAGGLAGAITGVFMAGGYCAVKACRHHEVVNHIGATLIFSGGATAGTGATGGAKAGPVFVACIAGFAAVIGLAAGGAHGWKAAREADSVSAAFNMGAGAAYDNVKTAIERTKELMCT